MKVGPGNLMKLCKRCCCGYDNTHKQLEASITGSKSSRRRRSSISSVSSITSHDDRPFDLIAFLGNDEFFIDDTTYTVPLEIEDGDSETDHDELETDGQTHTTNVEVELAAIQTMQKTEGENNTETIVPKADDGGHNGNDDTNIVVKLKETKNTNNLTPPGNEDDGDKSFETFKMEIIGEKTQTDIDENPMKDKLRKNEDEKKELTAHSNVESDWRMSQNTDGLLDLVDVDAMNLMEHDQTKDKDDKNNTQQNYGEALHNLGINVGNDEDDELNQMEELLDDIEDFDNNQLYDAQNLETQNSTQL